MNRKKFDRLWSFRHIEQVKEEFYDLVEIVEKIKPFRILEIGVLHGGTLKFWEQILPQGGLLIALDTHKRPELWNIYESGRTIRYIQSDSSTKEAFDDVETALEGEELDFLFIDANHEYEYVKIDFEAFSLLVRKGGLVCLSDLNDGLGGVSRVFDEFEGRKQALFRGAGNGYGLCWKE